MLTPRKVSTRGRLASGAPNPIDVHVGARMRLRRTLLGFSQEKMGGLIGLTFQQVQKYERGANRISASRLYDICRALDVPSSYFFDGMTDITQAQSPFNVIKGDPQALAVAAYYATGYQPDPMVSRETLELVRAYYAIPEAKVRQRIYDLAKSLAAHAPAAQDANHPLAAE